MALANRVQQEANDLQMVDHAKLLTVQNIPDYQATRKAAFRVHVNPPKRF